MPPELVRRLAALPPPRDMMMGRRLVATLAAAFALALAAVAPAPAAAGTDHELEEHVVKPARRKAITYGILGFVALTVYVVIIAVIVATVALNVA
jgi:hypothetical protein